MQASVHTFDPTSGAGEVLLDTGTVLAFGPEVFANSGLLHLRLGQRVSIETVGESNPKDRAGGDPCVTRLWIVGIGYGETIL